jgi:hypothetical protein
MGVISSLYTTTSASTRACAIAHGQPANHEFDIDEVNSRGVEPAGAPAIGADTKPAGYTLKSGSGCPNFEVHLTELIVQSAL